MSTKTNTEPPKDAEQEPDELQKLIGLAKAYGREASIVVGVVLVIILGSAVVRQMKQNKLDTSMQLMTTAQSVEQLQSIVTQFPDTPAAPLALLEVASMNFHQRNYELALMKYNEFIQTYPEHEGLKAAHLGKGYCLEALLRPEEALRTYDEFLTLYDEAALAPMAQFGKARVLEQMGRLNEARQIYEEYIAAHTEGVWTPQAEMALEHLDRKIRALSVPAQS